MPERSRPRTEALPHCRQPIAWWPSSATETGACQLLFAFRSSWGVDVSGQARTRVCRPLGGKRVNRVQQASVKRDEGVIARLRRPAGQEHRQFDFAALELPVMDEFRTGHRRYDHRSDVLLGSGIRDGGTRLVVILDELHELDLIVEPRGQMGVYAFGVAGSKLTPGHGVLLRLSRRPQAQQVARPLLRAPLKALRLATHVHFDPKQCWGGDTPKDFENTSSV